MENLKIRVSNESESREVQGLLNQLGYAARKDWPSLNPKVGSIQAWCDGEFTYSANHNDVAAYSRFKEITLPELRDIVVLNRNDVGDKTHYCESTNSDYFVSSDNTVYFFDDEKTNSWKISNYDLSELKPIEKKEMKEYLLKTYDGYKLITAENAEGEGVIEVPDGCNIITCLNRIGRLIYFHWKYLDSDEFFLKDEKIWSNNFGETLSDFIEKNEGDVVIIWQRESLNDKVASAEAYRQAEVLPFIDDEPKEKHSHYKKDISHLNILDVYRVLELFEVDSPCLQHAIKKLLCAGQRGAKDTEKDIQEAIDTLLRYKQMREEDNAQVSK